MKRVLKREAVRLARAQRDLRLAETAYRLVPYEDPRRESREAAEKKRRGEELEAEAQRRQVSLFGERNPRGRRVAIRASTRVIQRPRLSAAVLARTWYRGALPKAQRHLAVYRRKQDALRALFKYDDHNANVIDRAGGLGKRQDWRKLGLDRPAGAFDAANEYANLRGDHRIGMIEEALWHVFPPVRKGQRVVGYRPANFRFDLANDVITGLNSSAGTLRLPTEMAEEATVRTEKGERVSAAAEAEFAHALAQVGLTYDDALAELRQETKTGSHPFVTRNMVYDRLWKNVRAHLDTMGGMDRAAFLFVLDPRGLLGGSKSRAARLLAKRVTELNPSRRSGRRNPRSGDFLYDETVV